MPPKAYICPMCKGRREIDLEKWGLYSPSDESHFGKCPLCNGQGFVIDEEEGGAWYEKTQR